MPIQGLNHAVLYVGDAARSAAFYTDTLEFSVVEDHGKAVFLRAAGSTNDHDLGLFEAGPGAKPSMAGRGSVGLYHLAWEVDTLDEMERIAQALTRVGSLVGATDHGTTKALYAKDPDGIEFEVTWLVPADQLDGADSRTMSPLDIAKEKERYGGQTRGGVGISVPKAV